MEQFVTIHNLDEGEPFIGKYDGEYTTIPAGGQKTVPYDVMVVWMGDPKVENTDRYAERREVFNKLCAKHHARDLTGNAPDRLPKLEAYDDEGKRIVTVMDDPEGELLAPSPGDTTDIGKLQRQIDRLQARLEKSVAGLIDAPTDAPDPDAPRSRPEGEIAAEIAAENAELTGDTPAPTDDEDDLGLPEDTPSKIPVSAGPGTAPPTSTVKAPAKKAPAKKTTPTGRSRGTAGTAGKRAASRQK